MRILTITIVLWHLDLYIVCVSILEQCLSWYCTHLLFSLFMLHPVFLPNLLVSQIFLFYLIDKRWPIDKRWHYLSIIGVKGPLCWFLDVHCLLSSEHDWLVSCLSILFPHWTDYWNWWHAVTVFLWSVSCVWH